MKLLLTILVGSLGAYTFYKMKIPAGALIGAILFSGLLNIATGLGEFPIHLKMLVQAIAGGFIGQRITKTDLREMNGILSAALLIFVSMVSLTLVMGYFLFWVTDLDLTTALISSMPSGMSDVAIISADIGGNATQCTLMQLVRFLFSVMVLPQIAFRVCKKIDTDSPIVDPTQIPGYKPPDVKTLQNAVITVFLAESAGILGKLTRIPAGALTFAVIAVAAWNIKSDCAYLPNALRLVAQAMTGIIVGVGVTMQDILNLRQLILPAIITVFGLLIFNYLIGWGIHKICGLDFATCLFGTIPAGLSDMALIATEMGGDAPKVAVLHLVRYVGILAVMPTVIKLITQ